MLLLLRKDLFILRYYFLLVLLYVYLFGFLLFNNTSFIFVAALSAIMLMTISANLDSKNKSMIVIASLPVSSKSIVQAKYAAVLLFALIGIFVSVLVYILNSLIVGREMAYASSYVPIILLIIACYASLYYPIYYWLGFRASQVVSIITVSIPLVFIVTLSSAITDILSFSAAVNAAFLAASCLLLIVSYRLSIFFLERKGLA
ncbi:ABC-2 family transporter protein [Paenibacillus algorifonticola]|uniref:ABC-2 family transporter protein n=1 Tax=Paenibacillus algorifonticola TaxID=684063 RepID=A0A1I2G2U0_9BACL|nr:ABC-2 transporter permease [Paenibacillus algorifonticola]SFF11433.1 ABC-2 family transporter protein [Paenibacillus algorifonticola]